MNSEESNFFEILKRFRKLNISSILPGINHGDFAVMKTIEYCRREHDSKKCVRVSEVMNTMQIAAPALSRCLKMLESKQYILRTIDPQDRRNTCVELTEAGKIVLSEAEQTLNSFAEAVFGEMGREDMRRLNAYMEKLVQTAQQEVKKRTIKTGGKSSI